MLFQLFLGALAFPLWAVMTFIHFAAIEDPVDPLWHILLPMSFVVGGAIGVVGAARTLIDVQRPISFWTRVMLVVGAVTLVSVNFYGGNLTLDSLVHDTSDVLLGFVLPVVGLLHLSYELRKRQPRTPPSSS